MGDTSDNTVLNVPISTPKSIRKNRKQHLIEESNMINLTKNTESDTKILATPSKSAKKVISTPRSTRFKASVGPSMTHDDNMADQKDTLIKNVDALIR